MIRKDVTSAEIKVMMKMWLDINMAIHDFIPASYWKEKYDFLQTKIINGSGLVYEEGNQIKGFIGIVESYSTKLAALYVLPEYWHQGIGEKLLNACKELHSSLITKVYVKNTKAVHFFEKNDFVFLKEEMNEENGELRCVLFWEKK